MLAGPDWEINNSSRSRNCRSSTASMGCPAAMVPTRGSLVDEVSSGGRASGLISKERALLACLVSAPFLMRASTCSKTVTLVTPSSSASSCMVGE